MSLYFRFYDQTHWNDLQLQFSSMIEVREAIDKRTPDCKMMQIGDCLFVRREDLTPPFATEPLVEVFLLSEGYPEDELEKS